MFYRWQIIKKVFINIRFDNIIKYVGCDHLTGKSNQHRHFCFIEMRSYSIIHMVGNITMMFCNATSKINDYLF